MGISFDTATSTSGAYNSGSNVDETLGITIANQQNRVLYVCISIYDISLLVNVSAVKFGSTPMTKVVDLQSAGLGQYCSIYRLVAAPVGAGTVTVTFTANNARYSIGAVSLYGVNQITPDGATNTNSAGSGTPTVAITPTNAGAWLLDSLGINAAQPNQSKTLIFRENIVSSILWGASQYNNAPAIGSSNNDTWSNGSTNWVICVIEVIPNTLNTVSISDTISSTDVISKKIGKHLIDESVITDSISIGTKKITITDDVSVSEAISKKIGKITSDTLSVLDLVSKKIAKNISDTITTTDSITYLATVSKTLISKYTIYNNINKTLIIKYHILNTIQKSLFVVYTIFNTITNIMKVKYDIKNNTSKQIIIKYSIVATITKTLKAKYNIRNNTAKIITVKYTIISPLQITFRFTSHIVRERVGTSHIVRIKSIISKIVRVKNFNSYRHGI
jgi:hypothetical protein